MFMGGKVGRDSIWETHLAEELLLTDVELEAVLDQQVVKIGDVMNFKVGSQSMLNASPDTMINLRCGEVDLFEGRMGRKGDRIAVRIERRLQ